MRQQEAQGKHLFTLDIGLPLDRLGQSLKALLHNSDRPVTLSVHGTNRRGKPVAVKIFRATVGGTPEAGNGVILLMEASEVTAVH